MKRISGRQGEVHRFADAERRPPRPFLAWMDRTALQLEDFVRSEHARRVAALPTEPELRRSSAALAEVLGRLALLEPARQLHEISLQRAKRARAALDRRARR